jgi:hypothetical protein
MTRSLPQAPADDLFSDDFITASDIAVRDARRNNGRKAVRVEAPAVVVEAPVVVRCTRCHRVLKSAESIARGTGRTCERKVAAVLAYIGEAFTPAQIQAATELIADGGLVVGPHWTCLAVSSDGHSTYVVDTAAATCTCLAGQHGRQCYHLAASLAVTI